MPLASERLLAMRALALLFDILLDLLGSYDLLDTGQHLFGFREPQPKRIFRECPSLEAGDLFDMPRNCALLIGFNNDLYADLHQSLLSISGRHVVAYSVRRRLTA